MVGERLLAVQDAMKVHTQHLQIIEPVGVLPLQREKKGWWNRQRGITSLAGCLLIGVNGIGFANGLGKEKQPSFFHFDFIGGQDGANVLAVNHLILRMASAGQV